MSPFPQQMSPPMSAQNEYQRTEYTMGVDAEGRILETEVDDAFSNHSKYEEHTT